LFAGFLKDHPYARPAFRTGSWRLSKNGGRQYVKLPDIKKIWASSETCTGSCCTKATCSPKSGERMQPFSILPTYVNSWEVMEVLLTVKQNLQSAEEMEEEERAAQAAKLQELIRRGGPSDLQEANRLMKVMAGYDNRHKTDYRAKAAEEVAKVQQKAKLLEDMLQNHKAGDKVGEGDVFEVSQKM
jgi:hypothetical protein